MIDNKLEHKMEIQGILIHYFPKEGKKKPLELSREFNSVQIQTRMIRISGFPKHRQLMIRKYNRKKEPIHKSNKTIYEEKAAQKNAISMKKYQCTLLKDIKDLNK